jgi:sulfoacetaldehyde dehydrogenase
MTKAITETEKKYAQKLLERARTAMAAISDYDQARVNKICQAVGWASGNEKTFSRIARKGVEECGLGDWEGRPNRRFKIIGVLRDALRQKSMGVIEELPDKGIVKYAKPIGVIASLIPTTNPDITPPGCAIYSIKCKNAVIFSPHPRSQNATAEMVGVMRTALKREGVPEDVLQCVENPSIPLAQELMCICDLTIATGGPAMVKSAYSSGKPAYGVGAGNSTMVIDETANIEEAALNTRISKISDNGSGCSADGNLLVAASIYDAFLNQLQVEGGYLVTAEEKNQLAGAMWDAEGHRTVTTVARPAARIAEEAGFTLPSGKTFIIVPEDKIGKAHVFSTEKLAPVLAIFRYNGFDTALKMISDIYETAGKGHSCGIYSFNDDHIHRLALTAPVSRIMVRQPQSKANAGSFTNGMPMTSSLGCGTWGGNITSENISMKHYMNVTWVSRPIPEDRPSEAEIFGEFYNTETF